MIDSQTYKTHSSIENSNYNLQSAHLVLNQMKAIRCQEINDAAKLFKDS